MKFEIAIFPLFILLLFYTTGLNAQDTNTTSRRLVTGEYDGGRLYVALDTSAKKVSGYIEQKEGNAFCSLYFKGMWNDKDTVPISFYLYYIDTTVSDSGFLSLRNEEIKITSSGKGSVGSCSRLMSIQMDAGGEIFTLTNPCFLRQIVLLQKPKQVLFKKPNTRIESRIYLLRGDPVELIKESKNWYYIQSIKNRKHAGWVPANAVFK